jgi:hypothetical protein
MTIPLWTGKRLHTTKRSLEGFRELAMYALNAAGLVRLFLKRLFVFPLIAALMIAIPRQVLAQTNEGILAGTVVDPTGASVEGAQVTVTNEATHATLSSTSGGNGYFRFSSLQIGLYDVKVSHTGFQTVTQTGVQVQIANTTAVTITLQVGQASQTVTVAANTTRIQTESSDVGTVITSRQVVELPLALGGVGALRSPEAFVFLAPGTAGPGTANSNNGIFISKIGGGQNFGNDVLLDGASILRTENGSSFDEAAPSVEAISEFKVLTSTIPAEYGRTTGAIETFTTKSGTNTFHGTAYDILQNEDLNANSWFNNGNLAQCAPGDSSCRAQYARPVDKKNDYGVNLGGPVWIPKVFNGRDHTFFFFNWEQYRQNIGGTNTSIVPTDAERQGDFSNVLTNTMVGANPCNGSNVYQGEIFDPNTTVIGPTGVPCRTPFPGNRIPASRISGVSTNFLSYLPAPNIPAQASGINYALASSTPLYNTTYTIRIDQNISDKSKLFGMYDSRENARYAGNGTYTFPGVADSNGWNQDFITHYGRAGWDYIISPTLLNHLVIGYNRTNSQNYTNGAQQAIKGNFDWASRLGLGGVSGVEFPIVTMGEGVPQIGRANADANVDNGERFNDTMTWVRGNHSFTFGFDFRNQLYGTYAFDTDTGTYHFGRSQTAATAALNGLSGNGVASFLLGDLNNADAVVQGHVPRWTFQYYGAFIQDDWKATPHLTLNLGLRWDVDVPRVESHNDTSNFSPTAANPAAGNLPGAMIFGTNCNCGARWADTKFHDFGPRLGFAYNPHGGRIVIRGGYGILYSPLQYTDFGGSQVQGFSATPNFTTPDAFSPAFNWDSGFPAFARPPFIDPSVVNRGNPNYIQPRFGQPGIIQSWSFQIQGQVSKDTVATVGYVGQRAQNLRSAIMNVNNIPLSAFQLGTALNQPVAQNSLGVGSPYPAFFQDWGSGVNVQQALRPFPQFGYIYTDVLQNIGQSTYQSLQATLERRFSAGLSLQASFTWSKSLTDADSILPGINGGISQIQNPGDLDGEKALSSQDVPYMFTAAALYELPFGRGKPLLNQNPFASAILGGWQIGTVLRYQTGVPISFGCGIGIPGWDNCIRFNRVPGVSPLSEAVQNGTFNPFTQRYFNPTCQYSGQAGCAFADPNSELVAAGSSVTAQQARGGAYVLGNYPRNNGDARAPDYLNEDFSIIRNFRIKEAATFQIKAELLNAFNRHIFSIPDTAPNDSNFGVVNGTINAQRIVQFTARINF